MRNTAKNSWHGGCDGPRMDIRGLLNPMGIRTGCLVLLTGAVALASGACSSSNTNVINDAGAQPSDAAAEALLGSDSVGADVAVPRAGYDSLACATDGANIGGSVGVPFTFDCAKRYANDAAFRAVIADYLATPFDPSKAGTGTANTALYIDGRNPELAAWTAGAGPGGDPAIVLTIKGLNLPEESPTPELAVRAQGKHAVWLWVRRRYDPGYTAYGDADDTNGALTWNRMQGAGLKVGPYAGYGYADKLTGTTYYGRAGLQSGNGGPDSTADYSLINLPQGTPQPPGVNDTIIGSVTTEWKDGLWRDFLVYLGNTLDQDGVIRVAAQVWVRPLDGGAYVPFGPRLTGPIGPSTSFERPRFEGVAPYMLNANLSRKTDQHFEVWGWAAFDADTLPDPFAVLPK